MIVSPKRSFSRRSSRTIPTSCVWGLFFIQASITSAAHTLAEPASDQRVFHVTFQMDVSGQLETALRGGKAQAHDLDVDAKITYRERRLSGTGRDAEALRSLRYYDSAEVVVKIGEQTTSSRLPEHARLIVAQGQREGIAPYSPRTPLTAVDLELLRVSGDSLTTLGLLPEKDVEPGEQWTCDSWALQMLTGTEAVLKSDLKCTLKAVEGEIATIEYEGTLEGASEGAATEITVTGRYLYDLKQRHIRHFELTEKEKRVLGTRPGYDVVAKIVIERTPADGEGPLTDEVAASIPLEPKEEQLMLHCNLPWNARFLHDRNWHLFRQTQQVSVLRLLDKGSFIAQCNIAKVPDLGPGKHTSEKQFQEDIRKALGERLKEITKAELLKSEDGVYRYRVSVVGESNGVAMTWLYYLCAAPSGKQFAFVYAVESKLVEHLANRDLAMVGSVEFFKPQITPVGTEP